MGFAEERIKVICDLLKEQQVISEDCLNGLEYVKSGYKSECNLPKSGWKPFENGMRVEGNDSHYLVRGNFTVSPTDAFKSVYLKINTGRENSWDAVNPQGLLYLNGNAVQGVDVNHTDVKLESDKEYSMLYYHYTMLEDTFSELGFRLITVDERIKKLMYDISVPLSACKLLNQNSLEYINTVSVLEKTLDILDFRTVYSDEYYASIEKASDFIKCNLYESSLCGNIGSSVACIGHTHIDVAWLWRTRQTREKVQRSFATVLKLMDEYPEYLFMMSQPQLLQYVKEEDIALYSRIKECAAQGRFEIEGAMWLEADNNLVSGESLIRQIYFGKKFIKEEFGTESHILWLPDVFGYSAALPQILCKCGIDTFVTSKISWNESNKMPYDTFIWEGIDGSRIFTQFITAQDAQPNGIPANYTTYVGIINPSMVKGTWERYQQKNLCDEAMLVYGYGDGGGGPTRDMLEQQRRLNYGLPGIPKTKISTLENFIKSSKECFYKKTAEEKFTPQWYGELYLEFHRGTYTSIAKNKKNNRKSEFLMQKAEALSSISTLLSGTPYPYEEINSSWKKLLLNQFHDIVTGSSIEEVYNDSDKDYVETEQTVGGIIKKNIAAVAAEIGKESGTVIYNSLGFERNGTVEINGKCYETGVVPAFGWKTLDRFDEECRVKVENGIIENDYYVLRLDRCGRIKSLYDKRYKRQVFTEGMLANEIQIFEDFPKDYDNWEISDYYKRKMWVLDGETDYETVIEGNRAGLRFKKKYNNSEFKQTIFLYNSIERIDFVTEIDWHEHHQLVKAAFPLNVFSREITCDIQFGNIKRPLYSNTSWETAKFEICAHKWADISDCDYGVSILNDCKYGLSAQDNIIKQTLIKCGTYPNKNADIGLHSFTYSVLPHKYDFRRGNTVKEAYSLNQPLEAALTEGNGNNKKISEKFGLVYCPEDNIIIETLKSAEDGCGFIMRLYDAFGCKRKVTLKFGLPVKSVYLCDMLENKLEEIIADAADLYTLTVSNYEVVTLRIFFNKT